MDTKLDNKVQKFCNNIIQKSSINPRLKSISKWNEKRRFENFEQALDDIFIQTWIAIAKIPV